MNYSLKYWPLVERERPNLYGWETTRWKGWGAIAVVHEERKYPLGEGRKYP